MTDDRTQVQQLADFAVACRDEGLPDARQRTTSSNRILDVLGNCLAGRAESQSASEPDQAVLRSVLRWGGLPAVRRHRRRRRSSPRPRPR